MKLRINAKCSDLFSASLYDNDGRFLGDYNDYVPRGLGIGGGDYVEMTINLETGQIEDWIPLTDEYEVKEALKIYDEESDEDDE